MLAGNQKETGARLGIRAKFVLAFALPALVVAISLVVIQQMLVRRAMISQTVEQGSAIADTISATAGYYVMFGLTDDLKKIVADLRKNPSVE